MVLVPQNIGGTETTYPHGLGTRMFLDTRATNFALYTTKIEVAGPKILGTFTDRQWYENFRVSRETFQYIVSEVEHEIRRQDTKFRKAVCPSTKVAILLYYLGSAAEYMKIANLFGV